MIKNDSNLNQFKSLNTAVLLLTFNIIEKTSKSIKTKKILAFNSNILFSKSKINPIWEIKIIKTVFFISIFFSKNMKTIFALY